jgi:hypothetical protein
MYKGILCSMAGFKAYCSFGFWHPGMRKVLGKRRVASGMGQLGQIISVDDLPPEKELAKWIHKAMELNDGGPKVVRPRPKDKEPKRLVVPTYLMDAVSMNKKALVTFDAFSYSHKKEYVEWVTGAKREETRTKRLLAAVKMMAEGKSQNWKYERNGK